MAASMFFDIFGRDKGVTAMFDKVAEKAHGLGPVFEGAGALVGKLALPLAALGVGVGMKKFIDSSVESFETLAGSVSGLKRVMGGTTESVSGMRGAMQLAGVNVDDISGLMTKFAKNLGGADASAAASQKMLQTLGFNYRDAHGAMLPMTDILPKLADRFKSMPDGVDKTALAMSIFGKQGAAMLPFLNKGSAGIADLEAHAKKMGLTLDDVSIKIMAAGKVSARDFSSSIQGMKVQLGQDLAPVIESVENLSRAALTPLIAGATKLFEAGRGPAMKFASAIESTSEHLHETLGKLAEPAVKLAKDFHDGFSHGVDAIGSNQTALAHWGAAAFGMFAASKETAHQFFEGVKAGNAFSGPSLAGTFGAAGNQVHHAFTEAAGGSRAFFAAFKAGGDDITSSGFAGVLEGMGLKARHGFDAAHEGARVLFDAIRTGSNTATGGLDGMAATAGNSLHKAFGDARAAAGTFFDGLKTGANDSGQGGIVGLAGSLGNSLHGLFEKIGPMLPQILQLASSFSPLSLVFHALEPVLPQLVGMLGQLAATLAGALGQALSTIMPALQGLAAALVGALGQAIQTILPTLISLLPVVVQAFMGLVPVATQIIAAVLPLVAQLLPPLIGLFTKLVPVVLQLVQTVLPPIAKIVMVIIAAIVPLVQLIAALLIPIITALMPVITTVFNAIAGIILAIMPIIQGVIEVVLGLISGNWSMVWQGIVDIFTGIWQTIVAVVSGVLSVLGSVIGAGLNLIGGLVGGILGGIGSFFADTWNNIIGGVSGFIGQLLGFFSGLPGQIMGFLAGAGTWLYDAGKNIIDGLINGVKSMIGAIGNAILSLVPGPIVGVFKDALGIHSPSLVFHGFGENIGQGLINGVGAMVPKIDARMSSLVKPLDVPGIVAGAAGGSGSAGAGARVNTAGPALHIENINVNEAQQGGWQHVGNSILNAVQVKAPQVFAL